MLHGRDILAKMAMGAGNSLCFFLAPLAASPFAVGVVISPLNALMNQQVHIRARLGTIANACMYMFMRIICR